MGIRDSVLLSSCSCLVVEPRTNLLHMFEFQFHTVPSGHLKWWIQNPLEHWNASEHVRRWQNMTRAHGKEFGSVRMKKNELTTQAVVLTLNVVNMYHSMLRWIAQHECQAARMIDLCKADCHIRSVAFCSFFLKCKSEICLPDRLFLRVPPLQGGLRLRWYSVRREA